ncbi:DNA-binding transcriptional LysR family regulator [Streptomyces sp. LBL]|nr:DNA-binding transcriptional LysR family regulator [Streptomyces sp. LBL]
MSSPRLPGSDPTPRTRPRPHVKTPTDPQVPAARSETEPLNPGLLRTFLEVYRTGSFGRASRRLHISQPAVTHQIRMLEERFGTRLFIRQATGSRPTSAADSLARDAEGPVDALDFVVRRYSADGVPARPLRLGAPSDLMSDRILPVLADMLRDPARLRITSELSDTLLAQLAEGELDIVVARTRPRTKGISALPLHDEECCLVASPEVARAIPQGRAPGDTSLPGSQRLVTCSEYLPLVDHYWWSVFHTAVAATPAVVPDHRAVLAAVDASVGIAVLPTYLCAEGVARGTLVPLLRPEIPPITTTYLATRDGTATRPQVAAAHSRLLKHGRGWT